MQFLGTIFRGALIYIWPSDIWTECDFILKCLISVPVFAMLTESNSG